MEFLHNNLIHEYREFDDNGNCVFYKNSKTKTKIVYKYDENENIIYVLENDSIEYHYGHYDDGTVRHLAVNKINDKPHIERLYDTCGVCIYDYEHKEDRIFIDEYECDYDENIVIHTNTRIIQQDKYVLKRKMRFNGFYENSKHLRTYEILEYTESLNDVVCVNNNERKDMYHV